jgi:hypothetical protein
LFLEGQAPKKVLDPDLLNAAPKPGDGYKRGFVVQPNLNSELRTDWQQHDVSH